MKLIEILRKRASEESYDELEKKICKWLSSKVVDIISKASDHLKYVQQVFDKFDMHDAGHSEGVLRVMEDLLGDDAEKLSSYDLFSLIAVAYLHDCGMAVSDAEINVMKLVENDEYDEKKVCTFVEATKIIESSRAKIFKTERDAEEIKKWLFYPGSEQKLFDYYATLLRDYQAFRKGKNAFNKNSNHNQTNNELRLEYIRRTHADRTETYIYTWKEKEIANLLGNQPMGQFLFANIAKACKAHGKDAYFIKNLYKDAAYVGWESSNLQFVAMMLRISDIVHFDYNRAPDVLRALHNFEYDDSYEQWRIKADGGVNFIIKDRVIAFRAFSKSPIDYYNLMVYVDGIDHELELYNALKKNEGWEERYPDMPKKVVRDNMYHAKDFTPVSNLKFSLEQNKIMELLMGVKLYSDEYACLRELYQNSLDACRCQIAKDKSIGKDSKGEILFGLKKEKGEEYVYCLDNGKGMSKHIIENYLLKIGCSYYKSTEFYKSQAESGNTFTPISQFGIGILSCFMIGDRVEITTREDGKEYISCVMEYIHEYFYYKTTPPKDKDVISSSGTLIKIFLNSKYREKISDEYLENIGYLLWENERNYYKKHLDHLYFILDGFVKMVPKDITLNIQLSGGELIKIDSKPLPMGTGICAFPQDDDNKSYIEEIEKIEFKDLDVEYKGIRYSSYLILPTEKVPSYTPSYELLGKKAYCVDGIKVDDSFVKGYLLNLFFSSCFGGVLNFIGAERPQLSISREKIVNYKPEEYEGKIKDLLGKIVKQGIDKTAAYIAEKHAEPSSELYEGIWNSFFERFKNVPIDMVAQQLSGESIRGFVMPLPKAFTTSLMTYGDFWGEEEVCFEDYRMFLSEELMDCPQLLHEIIEYRIYHSASVSFDGNKAIFTGYLPNEDSQKHPIPSNGGLFHDYDIIASLYPYVSVSICRWSAKDIDDSLYLFSEQFLMIIMGYHNSGNSKIIGLLNNDLGRTYRESSKKNVYPELYSYLAEFFNKDGKTLFTGIFRGGTDKLRRYVDTHMIITFYIPISKEQLEKSKLEGIKYYFSRRNDIYDNNSNNEGFSIILFLNDYDSSDFYVKPGCWTRQELIDKIPDDVWYSRLSHKKYRFTDGTEVIRRKAQS